MGSRRVFFALRGTLWVADGFPALSDAARLVYLFMASHHDGNQAGLLRLPLAYIANDMNWERDKAENALQELAAAGWLYRAGDWIALSRLMEHDPPPNLKAALGAACAIKSGFDRIPDAVPSMLHSLRMRAAGFLSTDKTAGTYSMLYSLLDELEMRCGDDTHTVSIPMDTVSHHNHNQYQYQYQEPEPTPEPGHQDQHHEPGCGDHQKTGLETGLETGSTTRKEGFRQLREIISQDLSGKTPETTNGGRDDEEAAGSVTNRKAKRK